MNKSKFVIGLDIGPTSVSAVLYEITKNGEIRFLDAFVIIDNVEDIDDFRRGSKKYATSKFKRRYNRSSRRMNERKAQRLRNVEKTLKDVFGWHGVKKQGVYDATKLRIKGKSEKLNTDELCSMIYQYAGFRGFEFDIDEDASMTEYKKSANEVENWCRENSATVSDFFDVHSLSLHKSRKDDKGKVVASPPPIHTKLWQEELNYILNVQRVFTPQITDEFIIDIFDKIYRKRPKKSSKHLVSDCEFEKGKKATSVSNPYFELFRLWSELHNLRIKVGKEYTKPTRDEIFKLYDVAISTTGTSKISKKEILNILQRGSAVNLEGIKVPEVYVGIKNAMDSRDMNKIFDVWHKIYSHDDPEMIHRILSNHGFSNVQIQDLLEININRNTYASYSQKAIQKITEHMNGTKDFLDQHYAQQVVYKDFFEYEKLKPKKGKLSPLTTKDIRQPIVEKIWNKAVPVLNRWISEYGLDQDCEIRVELARDLRNSASVRSSIHKRNNDKQKQRDSISKFLKSRNYSGTKKEITRVLLWMEQGGRIDFSTGQDTHNGVDIYSGREITIAQALDKSVTNIEHTLAKSRFFDNSWNYITLSFEDFNKHVKKDRTAYEVVEEDFNADEKSTFYQRVKSIYKDNRKKLDTFYYGYDNMPESIPSNQLTQTAYIAKEFTRQLNKVFNNVKASSGKVTAFIRGETGLNQAFFETVNVNDKRLNHKHHALDAFLISLVEDSYIQRINNMNAAYLYDKKNDLRRENVGNFIVNDIAKKLGGSIEDIRQVAMAVINNILVLQTKSKYPKFTRNGSPGIRGELHEKTSKKHYITVDVFVDGKLNKKIKLDYIKSNDVKKIINMKYDGDIQRAFSENLHLRKMQTLKIFDVRNIGKAKVDHNYYDLGNQYRMDIFRDGNKFSYNVISLFDFANMKKEKSDDLKKDAYISLHKGDMMVLGKTKDEVRSALEENRIFDLTGHTYMVVALESSGGRISLRKHDQAIKYQSKKKNGEGIMVEDPRNQWLEKDVKKSFNSLAKEYGEDKIVKLKVLDDGRVFVHRCHEEKVMEKVAQ